MEIYYNKKSVKNNDFLRVSETQTEPEIKLYVNPNKYYTLIIHDPDAVGGTHIHLAKNNITNNDIKTGNTILPYYGPAPPAKSGKHRYTFSLHEQKDKNIIEPINERIIEIDELRKKLKVDKPILVTKFISENESGGKKRRRKTKRQKNRKLKKTRRH